VGALTGWGLMQCVMHVSQTEELDQKVLLLLLMKLRWREAQKLTAELSQLCWVLHFG